MLENRPKLPTLAERLSVPTDQLNLSFEHSSDRFTNEISQVSLESCLRDLNLIDSMESTQWKLFFKNLNFSSDLSQTKKVVFQDRKYKRGNLTTRSQSQKLDQISEEQRYDLRQVAIALFFLSNSTAKEKSRCIANLFCQSDFKANLSFTSKGDQVGKPKNELYTDTEISMVFGTMVQVALSLIP